MTLIDNIKLACAAPQRLTLKRSVLAVTVALAADGLQIPLQAVPVAPEIIDAIAMVITTWLLGFHLLLLPTFAVEFIPVIDMMPTWTGCVLAVIALRKRGQIKSPSLQASESPPTVETRQREDLTLKKQ